MKSSGHGGSGASSWNDPAERGSALWGSSRRGAGERRALARVASLTVLVLLALVPAAAAGNGTGERGSGPQRNYQSTVDYPAGTLLARAKAEPSRAFAVVIQTDGRGSLNALHQFTKEKGRADRVFSSIDGVSASLPGWALLFLAERGLAGRDVTISEDAPVELAPIAATQVTEPELWQAAAKTDAVADALLAAGTRTPTIAIVDSGVQPDRVAEFGGRVVKSVSTVLGDAANVDDDHGHGTFVASLAAGAQSGVAPTSDIVSVRVMDASGAIRTSDVIAAADWILANKDAYGIRVANFSLHSARQSSFRFDPLDRAVEKLWFSGIVVVASAGNFGDGTRKHMVYAPGNDPFVITVGATDAMGTEHPEDDTIPAWSPFGYTADGFAKPELVAPGRYMLGAVPEGSTLTEQRPEKVVSPGYMSLSGTSFSAPVVAGAAAQLLALKPGWGPDEIKGALMASAHALPSVSDGLADGIGTINVALASSVATPPNPNAPLNRFVAGGEFDEAAWAAAAAADVSWTDISWTDISWTDISWTDISWTDISWTDISWTDISWTDAAYESVSWADLSMADAAFADVSWHDVSWSDISSSD